MAASYSESTFGAPMDIESLNGANGSMDPTSLDHAAHKLLTASRTSSRDPAALECFQKIFRMTPTQIAALDRFHSDNPMGFVSIPASRGVSVHCPCLPPSTNFLPAFQRFVLQLPIPQGSSITPTQVMQMCFGGVSSVEAHTLYAFPAPPMPPVNSGYLIENQATQLGSLQFPATRQHRQYRDVHRDRD